MNTLTGQRVLVLGLGVSGLAMAHWCVTHGAEVTVVDTRPNPPGLEALQVNVPKARFTTTSELPINGVFDRAFKSPGLTLQQALQILIDLGAEHLKISGELDLFKEALVKLEFDCGYRPVILGVTGTNGKTTVTALACHLLLGAGKSAVAAGNIGPSLLEALGEALEREALPDVWVLELSSFQLADAEPLEMAAAVVLNITQDHLDWHGDMAAYRLAKARILQKAGSKIVNRDDPLVSSMVESSLAPQKAKPNLERNSIVRFGDGVPTVPGDYGLEDAQGLAWLVRASEFDSGRRRNEPCEIHLQRLMPVDAMRIAGRHNAFNALAALALVSAAEVPMPKILRALATYPGEPHRVELVAEVRGIQYFDDSKGTNTGATVAAINGLGPSHRLVLILGGDGKGQDFSPLLEPVARYARAIVLIGRDGPNIGDLLSSQGVPTHLSESLGDAVELASRLAQQGDAVLLSPACASLDMFRNYVHRAEVFQAAVRKLEGLTPESKVKVVA